MARCYGEKCPYGPNLRNIAGQRNNSPIWVPIGPLTWLANNQFQVIHSQQTKSRAAERSDTMADKPHLLLVTQFHPETVGKLDLLYQTHHLWRQSSAGKQALIRKLEGKCRVAATASWHREDIIYQLNSLEFIACFGVGVELIDFSQTRSLGIRVSNTPEVLNDSVADIALALILATLRNTINADKFVRSQEWTQHQFKFGHDLAGKTLGIIGLGRIGEAIVHRALAFKMQIAYHNRSPKNLPYTYYTTATELATNSDVLLCLLPGGEETSNAIGAEVFENLGPTGIFINVGRGSSVDEEALVTALEAGLIAGAGLDVYAHEPAVPEALLSMEQVVLFPHIGTSTVETRCEMGNLLIRNLQAFFDNKALISEVNL